MFDKIKQAKDAYNLKCKYEMDKKILMQSIAEQEKILEEYQALVNEVGMFGIFSALASDPTVPADQDMTSLATFIESYKPKAKRQRPSAAKTIAVPDNITVPVADISNTDAVNIEPDPSPAPEAISETRPDFQYATPDETATVDLEAYLSSRNSTGDF